MSISVLMPALSPTMTEGKLAKWVKKEGDKIKSGDVLAEIETDKATMEFQAYDSGTLLRILVDITAKNVTLVKGLRSMRDLNTVIDEIERSRVTAVWMAPAMIRAVLDEPGIDARDLASQRDAAGGCHLDDVRAGIDRQRARQRRRRWKPRRPLPCQVRWKSNSGCPDGTKCGHLPIKVGFSP